MVEVLAMRDLWERYGRPQPLDAGPALRAAGKRGEVHPRDVAAFRHGSVEEAEAYAAANQRYYGHPTVAITETGDGVIGITDLRPALTAHGGHVTSPAEPDGAGR